MVRLFKDILTSGAITIDGDGEWTGDFIIDDLCWAIRQALESDVGGEVVQIATGVETSILELAAMVQEVVGKSSEQCHGFARQGDIRRTFSAAGKVRRTLGWESGVTSHSGVKLKWEWFSQRSRGITCVGRARTVTKLRTVTT